MKLVLFTDAMGAGGAQRQLVGLASLLKQKHHNVTLCTYHEGKFYEDILTASKIEHVVVGNTTNKIKRILSIARYIKKVKPDFVIAYQNSPSVIACLSKMLCGGFKLLVSERNTNQTYTGKDRLRFCLYRLADAVVPNSYAQSNFIYDHAPFLKGKVHTISNFVDTDKFIPHPFERDNDVTHILTLGRITPQKNILTYIEAIHAILKQGYKIKVDWYGYADQGGSYYEKCKEKITMLDMGDGFEFHKPSANVVELYQHTDVFCLPSIYEGTPNVVCEAMSCGVPILCSDVCDNGLYVKSNGILFNPCDVNDIVEKIIEFINKTEEVKQEMRKMSRSLALEKFSSETFVSQYIDIIQRYV